MLSKYSKHNKSVVEIEYYYDDTINYLKSELEETIAERVKLNRQNKRGTGLKILTPNKLLTKLPILLAIWNKEIRYIIYLLCQHNKITKKN